MTLWWIDVLLWVLKFLRRSVTKWQLWIIKRDLKKREHAILYGRRGGQMPVGIIRSDELGR